VAGEASSAGYGREAVKMPVFMPWPQSGRMQYEKIKKICAGLVIIETSSKNVRLAHCTTQEYLTQKCVIPQKLRGGYHANVCIMYLAMAQFKAGACRSREALKDRVEQNAFLHYAARCLQDHLAPSDEQAATDSVALFVQDPDIISSYLQTRHYARNTGFDSWLWNYLFTTVYAMAAKRPYAI
jgi:hypothetical protein